MCGSSSSAPQPTDPKKTAEIQQQYNVEALNQTQASNAMGQETPFGALTYTPTVGPDGVTRYTATTSLSPQNQALLDALYGTKGIAGQGASNVLSGAYQGSPDITGTADSLMSQRLGAQLGYLNPFFDQQTNAMDARLRNQGLMPGTEGYENAMNNLRQSQGQTVSGATAQFMPEAFNEALAAYKTPAEMATTLQNLGLPMGLGLVNTPTATMQPANYQGAAASADAMRMQAYQNDIAQQNAMLGGLFGAAGNLGGAAILASDRRVKTDVKRVGFLDDGLPVYLFRYKAGGPPQIGLMAQDVEKEIPSAVVEVNGVKHVDYQKAAARAIERAEGADNGAG